MTTSLVLDIGGSFVKFGTIKNGTVLHTGLFPIEEKGEKDDIIRALVSFAKNEAFTQMIISMPGPMDYETGTSLMTHKFSNLYGISLKTQLQKAFPHAKISFIHDGVAFLLGEMFFGQGMDTITGAGVMLGTGLGFGFFQNKKVIVKPGLTPAFPLWNKAYQDKRAEDYVSGRAISRCWHQQKGEVLTVKEIAQKAEGGDREALFIFKQTGHDLGRLLAGHIQKYPVEKVIIGGQIAKALDLMHPQIQEWLSVPVVQAKNIEHSPLLGAYAYANAHQQLLKVIDAE